MADFAEMERIAMAVRRRAMELEFVPLGTSQRPIDADKRIAFALEYIAFQLGQINRKLADRAEDSSDEPGPPGTA